MLYLFRNICLIFQELLHDLPKILISGFGIIFFIASVIITLSLKDSVADFFNTRIFGNLDINEIKIVKKEQTSMFRIKSNADAISSKLIKKIEKLDGVSEVQKIIRLNTPVSLKAGVLGMYLKTDMLVSGADKSFFKDTFSNWNEFKDRDPVPVIIPLFVMDIYNNFASSNQLPTLGPNVLKMLSMEIFVGESSFLKTDQKGTPYKLKLFGFTEKITTAGIIVPKEFINQYCKGQKDCSTCIMIYAKINDINNIPAITKKIKSLGLNVESRADIAEKTGKAVNIMNTVIYSIIGIILLLTIIAVFNSYLNIVYNKHDKISLQRMLGASKLRIVFTFIFESGFTGVLYGLAGYFIGYFLLIFITNNLSEWIPAVSGLDLKIKGFEYLFHSVILSTGISVLSAFIPSVFAANINLFNAVKK